MRLHVTIEVPMGCPSPTCDGNDFYIVRSHPFGSDSTSMWVMCNKCQHHFYTDKAAFDSRVSHEAKSLLKHIEDIK